MSNANGGGGGVAGGNILPARPSATRRGPRLDVDDDDGPHLDTGHMEQGAMEGEKLSDVPL